MRMILMRICCLLVVLAVAATAQEFRATISGQVTDPTGAAVAGAKVVALSVERNVPYEAITNAAGRYVIQFLLPGKYTVTIEKEGFKKFVKQEIALFAADKVAVDAALELGAVTESVTATAEMSLLQTETATRQATIENRILENVPSGGRNLYALQYLEPGVVKTSSYWGSMELYAFGNVNGVSISGGPRGENETVLDGVSATRSDRGVAFVPSLQATQEFAIQTNSYDAEFGRLGGGVTRITLKSGTNSLHGQLYEFLKNEKFRANDWIANKNGEPQQPFKNNTFGFELDGPVYIPKVFDGRNRAFFMISLEGLRERHAGGEVRTLPTAEQLRGDFSKLFNDSGQLVSIYDPLTTQLGPNGQYVRTPFPGNVIPANRINPVAAQVASFYPAANRPGDGFGQQNNYAKFLPAKNGYDSWLGKLDYMFSERSHFSFRYGQTPWLNYARLVWGDNPAEPSNEYPSTRVARNWGADWTYTISPTVVLNIRGGLSRYEGFSGNTFGVDYNPAQLGFSNNLVSQFTRFVFPRFNLGTYSEIGPQGAARYETHDTYTIQPNVSWTYGRHLVKIGAEFRRYNDNNIDPGYASGLYEFTRAWTQANPLQGDAFSGNEFASFLLGYPASGRVDSNIDPAFRSHYYALFIQDDFKVTQRLTLNLGLRWDYESPRFERYNRMLRGFGFGQASPIAEAVKAAAVNSECAACKNGLTGGLVYAGDSGDLRYAFEPKKLNFQPRIGAAYRLTSRLVFRGGYGLSYLGQSANGQQVGFSRQTPVVASTDGNLTPAATLSDPFPASIYPNGLLKPIGNSQGLATNLGQNVTAQYLDRPLPYSQQFSAGFQYELPGGWLVDASYVGNITKRMPVSLALNFVPLDVQESIPVAQRAEYFNQQVPNPMAGLLPNSGLNGATVPRRQLYYAYPQFAQVTITDVPIGSQNYHSGQFKVTRRFSKGLSMTVAYTIAKNLEQVSVLNPQDVNLAKLTKSKLEQRLTEFDVPQQFSVIGTYDLPFGRNRYFLSNVNRVLDAFIGGWTFSGVWMSHSGFPLAFPNAAPLEARSAKLTDKQRDALAKQAGRSQYDVSYDIWFDTSLFPRVAGPAPFTLRTFPTRFPDVRSKPLNVADISLYKEFLFKEKVRWQIRCDAHNAGNFPWFGRLDSNGANVTSPLFGHLRADMGNEPRVVVFVMKVLF